VGEVHAQRLRTLLDIYAARQQAAGKPMKRLNGMKFWITGHVVERAVVTDEGTKLLVTDSAGDCFIVMHWMSADGDNLKLLKARSLVFCLMPDSQRLGLHLV
jgi:hypothetical protein